MENTGTNALGQHSAVSGKGGEQFPVDTRVLRSAVLKITGTGDLVRIVVTNDQETSNCAPHREYHHGNTSISIQTVDGVTLQSGTLEGGQTGINEFVGSFPMHIDSSQFPSWRCGVYSPSADRKRLYRATDPDDTNKRIGLLIEQDNTGRLVQLTWYKTVGSGPIFQTTPTSLAFDLVKDGNGNASLDPNDIGGWTWYYTQ